jgi:thioredoxin-dependent peroxiredoxin
MQQGDKAPEFEREAHDGTRVKLSELRGKNVILYFYPKDFTSVCTTETCGFRDLLATLGSDVVQVIGVSGDSLATHRKFAEAYNVPFPLLADEDHSLGKLYEVYGGFRTLLGISKRVTFVINKEGFITSVIAAELSAAKHLDGVRQALALK